MNPQETDPVLAPFYKFVDRIKLIAIAMIALGATPPLLELIFGVGAPWPNAPAVAYFTTAIVWIILLIVHASAKQSGQSRRRLFLVMCYSGVATLLFSISYITAWARVVKNQTTTGSRIVGGIELLDGARDTIIHFPEKNEVILLAASEWRPELVYTANSLAFSRVWILVSWLGFFGCLAATTALYVVTFEMIHEQEISSQRRRANGVRSDLDVASRPPET